MAGMDNIAEIAEFGYNAYGDFVGWKNYAGLPMPKWAELPEKIRHAWTEAACAIRAKSAELKNALPPE